MNDCRSVLLFALALAFCLVYPPAGGAADNRSRSPLSEREQNGLRGPVKSCIEETTSPGSTTSDGKEFPEVTMRSETDYDLAGRLVARLDHNPGGSVWATRYTYDTAGNLLKIASGKEGDPPAGSVYSYDDQGRLSSIDNGINPPITFSYQSGRKTKKQVSRAEDYRPNVAVAADSPFQATDMPPNQQGGGTAVTSYDENDRPVEVQVVDAHGEMISRAVRIYDAEGRVSTEKQIVEDPLAMFPADVRAKILQSSDSVPGELREQMTAFMGGHEGFVSVQYTYDAQGRVKERLRQIFNQEVKIQNTYNEQGDQASESTRTVRTGGTPGQDMPPANADVRYSYQYDAHGNWTEKITAVSPGPDGIFAPTSKSRRTLTYF